MALEYNNSLKYTASRGYYGNNKPNVVWFLSLVVYLRLRFDDEMSLVKLLGLF